MDIDVTDVMKQRQAVEIAKLSMDTMLEATPLIISAIRAAYDEALKQGFDKGEALKIGLSLYIRK